VLAGTLNLVLLLPSSPLVVLQGGGTSPLYPPNKAVIFHDGLGLPIAELEFGQAPFVDCMLLKLIKLRYIASGYGVSPRDKG
jgi:hypothetical protein